MIFKYLVLIYISINFQFLEAFSKKECDQSQKFFFKADFDTLEFRYHLKNKDQNNESPHWFVSFGNIQKTISKILPKDITIRGQFKHGNYSGNSYYINLSENAKLELEKIRRDKYPFGIWDYIYCESAIMYIEQKNLTSYEIHIEQITNPVFQWDD